MQEDTEPKSHRAKPLRILLELACLIACSTRVLCSGPGPSGLQYSRLEVPEPKLVDIESENVTDKLKSKQTKIPGKPAGLQEAHGIHREHTAILRMQEKNGKEAYVSPSGVLIRLEHMQDNKTFEWSHNFSAAISPESHDLIVVSGRVSAYTQRIRAEETSTRKAKNAERILLNMLECFRLLGFMQKERAKSIKHMVIRDVDASNRARYKFFLELLEGARFLLRADMSGVRRLYFLNVSSQAVQLFMNACVLGDLEMLHVTTQDSDVTFSLGGMECKRIRAAKFDIMDGAGNICKLQMRGLLADIVPDTNKVLERLRNTEPKIPLWMLQRTKKEICMPLSVYLNLPAEQRATIFARKIRLFTGGGVSADRLKWVPKNLLQKNNQARKLCIFIVLDSQAAGSDDAEITGQIYVGEMPPGGEKETVRALLALACSDFGALEEVEIHYYTESRKYLEALNDISTLQPQRYCFPMSFSLLVSATMQRNPEYPKP